MMNRRHFLACAAGASSSLLLPTRLLAQSGIKLEKLNFLEIRVNDLQRSINFHQQLFGMPVQSRNDGRTVLKIGADHFMAIRPVQAGETPAITHYGYSVTNYDLDTALDTLKAGGFTQIDAPGITVPGIDNAMSTWVQEREGTPTLYLADARGLILQLTDPSWCAGSGALGNVCSAPQAVAPGSIALSEINHFTTFVNGGPESAEFYESFFGIHPQAYQATTPSLGIGDGKQFVMFAGGPNNGQATPANIHHVSYNMDGFIVDEVLGKLEEHGVTARGDRQLGPMMHYISLRMPDRGGAEGGTPEVYFTDVDGILMQIQDSSYCGGGGYLGDICTV